MLLTITYTGQPATDVLALESEPVDPSVLGLAACWRYFDLAAL